MDQQRLRPEYSNSRNCETGYLAVYGNSAKGACYRNEEDARRKYALMLEVIRERDEPVTLLDFGCGPAHLYRLFTIIARPPFDPIHSPGYFRLRTLDIDSRRRPEANLLLINVLKELDAGAPGIRLRDRERDFQLPRRNSFAGMDRIFGVNWSLYSFVTPVAALHSTSCRR